MLKRTAIIAAMVLGQALTPLAGLAANDRIEEAAPLTSASAAVSDTLVGNSGGAFRYYSIEYPGGGLPIPIQMRAQPGRGTAGVATGFKLYGPTGFVGEAVGDDRSVTDSLYAFTLASTVAGTYHIQVYNFIEGLPLSFQLSASNLPGPAPAAAPAASAAPGQAAAPAAAPAPAVGDNSVPERAIVLTQTSVTTGGLLEGRRDGRFHYYELDYPGGSADLTLTIGYSPVSGESEQGVGFKLYRRDATATGGAVIAGESAQTGRNESSATEGFTLKADAAERYLLQVHNYTDHSINYTLIATGLAGPIAEVGDISSPGQAFVLSPAQPSARGAFKGDPSGRFHYFLYDYPGSNRAVRITVTAEPNSEIGEGMFGFNLYRGTEHAGHGRAGLDDKGRRTASVVINEADARMFGIQIFNYAPGAEARYAITITGF